MRRKRFFIKLSVFSMMLAAVACTYDFPAPRQSAGTAVALSRTSLVLNLWTDDGYDRTTAVLTANQTVFWGSNDSNIATVADGLVTAAAVGTTIITAVIKDGGLMTACTVVVVDQAPGAVQEVSIPAELSLYLGGTNQHTLSPVFTPFFVTNETVTWASGNTAVVAVNQNGTVTAVGMGTADITVTTADGGFTSTCTVRVIPLWAQFKSIADFLMAGNTCYKPGFDFGTDPVENGDTESNTSTWSGANTNQPDFVLNYTYDYALFGKAGDENLIPEFAPPPGTINPGPYRSHTQFNYASIAHFAFTGYRQAHPWGINSIGAAATRAGQTWSAGINAYAANTNNVQFSGIGVDLGRETYIDTVVIYAGGSTVEAGAFNSADPGSHCPGITLEYMTESAANATVFDRLYKANLFDDSVTTANWNNPGSENNWPAPGYQGSPWIWGGKIVPNGSSWVYVFHFEEPVPARYLRCNFEQAPVAAPAAGFLGRALVNSFEVYNTRAE